MGQIIEEEEERQEFERDRFDEFIRSANPNSPYNRILKPKRRRRFTDSRYIGFMGDENPNNYDNWVMPVSWIQNSVWDSEMYQAFHRNRGLQNNRVIFAYCWFPPEILKELHIESVNRDDASEKALWEKLEREEKERRLMNSLIKEISLADRPNLINTHISEKYRMFGKENRDKIKQFINTYLEIKERIKPPKK